MLCSRGTFILVQWPNQGYLSPGNCSYRCKWMLGKCRCTVGFRKHLISADLCNLADMRCQRVSVVVHFAFYRPREYYVTSAYNTSWSCNLLQLQLVLPQCKHKYTFTLETHTYTHTCQNSSHEPANSREALSI